MTDDELANMVFKSETPQSADLAIVFGAGDKSDLERRTKRGIELYREGFVPSLLLSGGGVLVQGRTEAARMADIAAKFGVPVERMLLETRSANTFQNAQFSRALLEETGKMKELSTIILVSSEWHMHRVLLTMRSFFARTIRMICCPTPEGCSRQNWTAADACRRTVLNEAALLQAFLDSGAISAD